jgi:hypothetical protein
MNRLKGVSRHFCSLLDTEREHVNDELSASGCQRLHRHREALAASQLRARKMQEACMWACRAEARPDADC